jgi:hypothetical protein
LTYEKSRDPEIDARTAAYRLAHRRRTAAPVSKDPRRISPPTALRDFNTGKAGLVRK